MMTLAQSASSPWLAEITHPSCDITIFYLQTGASGVQISMITSWLTNWMITDITCDAVVRKRWLIPLFFDPSVILGTDLWHSWYALPSAIIRTLSNLATIFSLLIAIWHQRLLLQIYAVRRSLQWRNCITHFYLVKNWRPKTAQNYVSCFNARIYQCHGPTEGAGLCPQLPWQMRCHEFLKRLPIGYRWFSNSSRREGNNQTWIGELLFLTSCFKSDMNNPENSGFFEFEGLLPITVAGNWQMKATWRWDDQIKFNGYRIELEGSQKPQ